MFCVTEAGSPLQFAPHRAFGDLSHGPHGTFGADTYDSLVTPRPRTAPYPPKVARDSVLARVSEHSGATKGQHACCTSPLGSGELCGGFQTHGKKRKFTSHATRHLLCRKYHTGLFMYVWDPTLPGKHCKSARSHRSRRFYYYCFSGRFEEAENIC